MNIRGAFPGGPTRTGSGRGAGGVRLRTVEEMELARARHASHRRTARRRTRRTVGVVAVSAAALAAGGFLGWTARQSRDDLVEAERPQATLDRIISGEVNRTLLELWKMESLESTGRYGRIR